MQWQGKKRENVGMDYTCNVILLRHCICISSLQLLSSMEQQLDSIGMQLHPVLARRCLFRVISKEDCEHRCHSRGRTRLLVLLFAAALLLVVVTGRILISVSDVDEGKIRCAKL